MDANKNYNKTLTTTIRLKRIERGITQAELAKNVNISPIIYGHIESGRRELKIYEFVNLCHYLDIDIDETLESSILNINENILTLEKKLKNKVISFTSFKGGVGVSTLSILLSNEISKDYKIILIDSHYQNSCYDLRMRDIKTFPETKPLYEIKTVPFENLANYLSTAKTEYDYIIIDLPKFFYIEDHIENIIEKSDFVFAPFHLRYNNQPFETYKDEPLRYADGRLDLFVNLRERSSKKGNKAVFSLIPFRNNIDVEFKEYIENYDITLIPETFKEFEEIPEYLDTINPISTNENSSFAPYIMETMKVLYYLMEITDSNLVIEDQKNIKKLRWKNLFDRI
ncbi:helix-turn-helix domain-containing protein [Aquimarina algicola]|uniref:Helix-turn-helix domain-containing protein n=1 Tax=Aquimarina algicola TaxID=2589995 RepID=A0A504JEE8_9FLAO|nr:helix-turn-helix domain-containing protein [Aquimarina algicola]TPN86088.1 helix-turn-helix domain-containing protein [Aquimarina algicola]